MRVALFLLGVAAAVWAPPQKAAISKVVELLKELQAKIHSEEKADETSFNRFACWCESQSLALAKSIKASKEIIGKDTMIIVEKRGTAAVLAGEISDHNGEIAKARKAIAQAQAKRAEENAFFVEQTKELSALLITVEKAIDVLSSARGEMSAGRAGLLQRAELEKLRSKAGSQFQEVLSLLITKRESFLQSGRAPQSDTIVGILKQMWNDFSMEVQKLTSDELVQQKDFEAKIEALQTEIADHQAQVLRKTEEKTTAEAVAGKTEAHKVETQDALAADMASFEQTEEMCKRKSQDWKDRTKIREDEKTAIQEALAILDNDAARASFKASADALFVQKSSLSSVAVSGNLVKEYCETMCANSDEPTCFSDCKENCNTPSCEARLAAKKKVVDLIDNLVTETKNSIKDDIQNKRDCEEHEQKYTLLKQKSEDMVSRFNTQLAKQEMEKKVLEDHLATAIDQIKMTTDTQAQAKADRGDDKAAHKQRRADDEAALKLMRAAIAKLEGFYQKHQDVGTTLVQQEPEFGFKKVSDAEHMVKGVDADYKGSTQGNVVIRLLRQIIQDTVNETDRDQVNENEEQAAWEKLDADLTAQLKALNQVKAQLEADIADKEKEIVATKGEIDHHTERLNVANSMLDETENTGEAFRAGAEVAAENAKFKSMEYCKWVYASFRGRTDKNKGQIATLNQMKHFIYMYNVKQ